MTQSKVNPDSLYNSGVDGKYEWLDEILTMVGRYRMRRMKSAIATHFEAQNIESQLTILRGFRRRDFSNDDIYQVAVLDRIAELQAKLNAAEGKENL